MDENVYVYMLAEYKNQLAEKTQSEIELQSLLIVERSKSSLLEQEFNSLNAVLASDAALKELFEEAKEKLQKETLEEA
ncbi:hypothetical protein FXF62_10220 [Streptococcus cristatus]|uniref:Uncharacterized protein n=1 Tax=Streptococcus cristatus TaxID=45634 RepID=A0A5B0DDW2_STRCR|nr:hypothetical protein [Streptococcus cristatus]KAA0963199.1 hypothetical protein FXF62_10220 [Streptococcus cristatus]